MNARARHSNKDKNPMEILVLPGGLVRCLYDEAIDLAELGRLTIVRASHVEPDADGNWYADLAPVGGPKLGPYARRSDALAAEQKWLEANHICRVHCEGAAPV